MNKGIHLKGLNGIRTIAAFSVVVSHVFERFKLFGIAPVKDYWDFSAFGVTMFFSLSGFLITYLLLIEKDKYNTINIRSFYVRRILRIWPLYYFYFLVAILLTYIYFREHFTGMAWLYVFLAANLVNALHAAVPLFVHYWSLGVEEQFYLFWPWLIKKTKPLHTVIIFSICFLALKFVVRLISVNSFAYQLVYYTRFDCMSIGALGAILYYNNVAWFKKIMMNPLLQLTAWIMLITSVKLFTLLPDIITHELVACITVVIIINAAFNKKPLVGLENRVLDFLGRISYGIYVYHILVIFILQKTAGGFISGMPYYAQLTVIFATVIFATILIAYLSYRYFESPFLKLKERFSKVASQL